MMGVAHVAIQFPLYEALKERLAERHHRDVNDLPAADLACPPRRAGSSLPAACSTAAWLEGTQLYTCTLACSVRATLYCGCATCLNHVLNTDLTSQHCAR